MLFALVHHGQHMNYCAIDAIDQGERVASQRQLSSPCRRRAADFGMSHRQLAGAFKL